MVAVTGALLVVSICAQPARGQPAPLEFDGVGRVVAVSDLHGAHDAFVATLLAAGVLDGAQAWAGGRTHLVVLGDLLDRGDHSRASLDLLMRLEGEAAAAGGRVHVVLGNHDVMNLVGDLRYVTRGEFAAFAAEETASQREAAYARHLERHGAGGQALSRPDFDARFPPGYFAHRAAFAASGPYGRWLLGKPLALRIDGTLFVHAGLAAGFGAASIEALDRPLRAGLAEYAALLEQAVAAGWLEPTTDFYDVPAVLGGLDVATLTPDGAALLERLRELHGSPLHTTLSPTWYRGNAGCSPLVEQDRLADLLRGFGARRVVIGHTPTWRRQAWRRLGDRVWMIDGGMQSAYYSGQGVALVLEGDAAAAVYQGESRRVPVATLPARAGALSADLDPEELEGALASAGIVARDVTPAGDVLVLRWRDTELRALARPLAAADAAPEVAAYRVDRLLDLAMVPAAVLRRLEGRDFVLQHLPPSLVAEARRAAGEVRLDAWCPLPDQWRAMHVFDALIGHASRSAEHLSYVAGTGQLVLAGHEAAFPVSASVPQDPQLLELAGRPLWRERLAALGSAAARERLLEVLGERQYEALLRRARALAR